jgi:hypothetical protein
MRSLSLRFPLQAIVSVLATGAIFGSAGASPWVQRQQQYPVTKT